MNFAYQLCASVTEWNLGAEEGTKIEAKNDLGKVESIRISGYIDRIDEVILPMNRWISTREIQGKD